MTAAVVDEYQAQTEALAAATVAGVLALYAALQSGGLAASVVVPAIASVVATANAAATTLADLAVTAQIEVASGVVTPPTGITPRDDTERLMNAIETILDDDEPDAVDDDDRLDEDEPDAAEGDADELDDEPDADVEVDQLDEPDADEEPEPGTREDVVPEPQPDRAATRLERLARSEPLDTGQNVVTEIVDQLTIVTGWTRKLDANPCGRCLRWAEDGRVFPKGAHFKRHYGCNCQAEIVTATTTIERTPS